MFTWRYLAANSASSEPSVAKRILVGKMSILSIRLPPRLGYSLLTISTVQWAADDQADAPQS
jgi:hypothetical protein